MDPSLFEMDPALYKAAVEGNIDPFENYQTCLNQLMTRKQNTILHVYLENQSEKPKFTDFVGRILEMCPQLFLQVNIRGETPLHFAARYGHANVVKVLIDRAKALPRDPENGLTEAQKMMRMTNVEKDTALHEAARNDRGNVVEILTKEDPEFSYSANDNGETPLYIAITKVGFSFVKRENGEEKENREKVIGEILRNCSTVDYGGPNGRTALHAAAMARDRETARKILEKEKNLTKATDQKGWTSLHYAAYFRCGSSKLVKLLLEYDASAAYIVDTDKKRTALHIAAVRGNLKAMKEIVSCCPSCRELVDNRGWNALHYAVATKSLFLFKKSLEIPEFGRLKTEKDDKGNTPFHLIAALALAPKHWDWRKFLFDGKLKIYGLNKENLSVRDIMLGYFTEIQQKEILESVEDVGSGHFEHTVAKVMEEDYMTQRYKERQERLDKGREAHLVVAALIATVTFAAAFTLPGGYKNEKGPNQGTAILTNKAAFIVFVISDAMAMVLSISAVFIHFWMVALPDYTEGDSKFKSYTLFWSATWLTMIAMASMVIAFITGTYAVLATSLGLAITTCFIGLSFFLFVLVVFRFRWTRFRCFLLILIQRYLCICSFIIDKLLPSLTYVIVLSIQII